MKNRDGLVVMLLIWMVLWSMIVMIPDRVKASSETLVDLTLQQEPPQVDVSHGSTGLISISGNVSCRVNGTEGVKVFLEAKSDIGSATLDPSIFYFEGGNGTVRSRSFNITTRVPQGYPSNEPLGISVTGYFTEGNQSYPISDVTHTIDIQPYYDIEVETYPYQEIGAGEFVYFHLLITNTGNSEDTYEFIFDNLGDLCGHAWTIATITPKTLGAGQTQTIVISAQAPQTWSLWRNQVQPFNLRILSQNSRDEGGDVKCYVTLYVRLRGSHIPGFSPSFAIFGILFVSLALGKKKWMSGKGKSPNYPKDLYSELSMSIR